MEESWRGYRDLEVDLMRDPETTFEMVKQELADFNAERDWDRYHNPKDLAVSISIESAELLENFQWQPASKAGEVRKDSEKLERIKDEMADLLIYLFIMSNQLDIDIASTVFDKIEKNKERFSIGTTF